MKMSKNLIDYLYYDEKKLDSYLEQFSSPIQFEKSPQWKVGLNLAGPIAEGTQIAFPRPLTKHEKVEKFTKFVVDNSLISGSSFNPRVSTFVDVTLNARRAFIPEKSLGIWVSEIQPGLSEDHRWRLFLIEDHSSVKDESSYHFSGYSSLYILAHSVRDAQKSIRDEDDFDKEDTLKFARDPFSFLTNLGAIVGPPQRIRSIFRIRVTATELEAPGGRFLGVVGYPVFVERADQAD